MDALDSEPESVFNLLTVLTSVQDSRRGSMADMATRAKDRARDRLTADDPGRTAHRMGLRALGLRIGLRARYKGSAGRMQSVQTPEAR